MASYRLAAAARADIINILTWTQEQFGETARQRYQALIIAGLRDIARQPTRPGSLERPELGESVRSWHLGLSRDRAGTDSGIVRRPRHFLIYRSDGERVLVGRVLHEAMELTRHLSPERSWE